MGTAGRGTLQPCPRTGQPNLPVILVNVDVPDPQHSASSRDRMSRLLISGCEVVVTMAAPGTELAGGSMLVEDGVIYWVGAGRPPAAAMAGADVLDGRGCVAI